MVQLVLASGSPKRLGLLQAAGINPIVHASNFDESQIQLDKPQDLVRELATHKAKAVAPHYPSSLVLGCDSVLYFEGKIYGKPATNEEVIDLWLDLQHKSADIYSGHTLIDTATGKSSTYHMTSTVYLGYMSDKLMDLYLSTGEPLRGVGGFSLKGIGNIFVARIEGCYTNVTVGLSLALLQQMLVDLGHDIADLIEGAAPS